MGILRDQNGPSKPISNQEKLYVSPLPFTLEEKISLPSPFLPMKKRSPLPFPINLINVYAPPPILAILMEKVLYSCMHICKHTSRVYILANYPYSIPNRNTQILIFSLFTWRFRCNIQENLVK